MEEEVDLGSGTVPAIKLRNATIIDLFGDKDLSIRVVVGITCALSITGSVLLILSYLVQRSHTRSREILAHISLMDLGVALSNLIGLSVYFDQFYTKNHEIVEPPAYINGLCKTQAFFAEYCTLGSIFWTTALAAYLYILILHQKSPKFSLYFVRFCYILCYGLAIGITVWLLIVGRLGYAPYDSSGWCSVIAKDPESKETSMFIAIFAYDFWVYLAIVLIILFCIAIWSFISSKLKAYREQHNIPSRISTNFMDYKFILIPVTFILLRMWTCILGILTEYASVDENKNSVVLKILLHLGGIGDSGQGFVNAILFIAFTKQARNSLKRLLCCKCFRNHINSLEDTTSEEGSPTFSKSSQSGEGSPLLYGSTEGGGPLQPAIARSGGASVNKDAPFHLT